MAFFDFSSLRKDVANIASKKRALADRIEALKREREDISNAPPAKSDLFDMMAGWVESSRQKYMSHLRVNLSAAFRTPQHCANAAHAGERMTLCGASGQEGGLMLNGRSIDQALCMFLGPQLLEGLGKALDAMPAGGLPLAKRQAAVAKLDQEIGELQAQEAELLTTARAVGIVLE